MNACSDELIFLSVRVLCGMTGDGACAFEVAECGCFSQSDESTDDDGAVQDKSQLTTNTMDATDDDATDVIVSINVITTVGTINTADTPELEGAISSPVRHQRPHLFFCTLTAVAIGGMGVVSFGVLAGGKVGLFMFKNVGWVLGIGLVEYAVTINAFLKQGQTPNLPHLQNAIIVKRGVCWLAVGLLMGTVCSFWKITFVDQEDDPDWQPVPILLVIAFFIGGHLGLVAVVMARAHRDRQNNMIKLIALLQFSQVLTWAGPCSPYPLVTALGRVLNVFTGTVGMYLVVAKLDKDAELHDVQNGYKYMVGTIVGGKILDGTLWITSVPLNRFVVSAVLMLCQKLGLKVMIPVLKLCFGSDDKKWSFLVPAFLLALELGPCLLLLGSDMSKLEFWLLIAMQEVNSVAKNVGKFDELYVAVRARLRRPVDEEILKLMEERRATIAPCDNIGEIVSPAVIMIVIGLEAAFEWLPVERAPYTTKNGILGGWRNQRFRGEAPVMLSIVFAVRVAFCWIEVKVRAHQRRNKESTTINAAGVDLRSSQPDGDIGGENNRSNETKTKARRSSMAVLYHRIVSSDDVPVHMQYLAGASFVLQPILFIVYAARDGRQS